MLAGAIAPANPASSWRNTSMMGPAGKWQELVAGLAALLVVAGSAYSREQPKEAPFQYAGGTEVIEPGCRGNLEVTTEALIFNCPTGSIEVPYSSITLMQYRPDLSRRVRRLKLQWKARPNPGRGKRNRYFTVVYKVQNVTHVMILKVAPLSMRPYLAEIDLRAGRRVEVKGYEEYE
jgi:hypothetical protein